jgi:AraC-like DNA-binding protein
MPDSMQDFRSTFAVGTGWTLSALAAQQGELSDALPGFGDGSVGSATGPRHDYAQCAGGLAPWQLRRAQQMLLASIESNLPLRHVSEACRLSVSHFARAFKISTGLSPLKWLIALRVDLSRRALMASDISLVDVAAMYGFSDQSHFSRVFRRAVGRSPGAWRREYRDESHCPEPRSTTARIDFIAARNGWRDAC